MMQNKVYIIQKDLQHPAYNYYKAGTEFSKTKGSLETSAYVSPDGKRAFAPDIVENNPEWFLLKEEDKKQRVESLTTLGKTFDSHVYDYILSITGNEVSSEKLTEIKEAIDIVLSDGKSTLDKKTVDDKWYHPITGTEFNNIKINKDYEILECYYIDVSITHEYIKEKNIQGNKSCKELGCKIHSVRRNNDFTIWTVGDIVNIAGHKELEIVALNEALGVLYANLKWNYNGTIHGTQTVLHKLKKL